MSHGRFKRQLNEQDVEIICRALLAYCLVHYRGDEKIKSFIWDLITPTEDGQTRELQNHLGKDLTCFCSSVASYIYASGTGIKPAKNSF